VRAALLGLLLAAALPAAAQAREPGLFCLDRAELADLRKNASSVAQKVLYGDKGTFAPMIAMYEDALQRAERGDDAAQRQIGGFWAACVLQGDGMSEHKQATAARYLRTAADAGDQQALHYLAQFYALGTGVPADYAESYRLVVAAGYPADAVDKTAATLKIVNAPPAERQASLVYGELLRALLKQRLQALAREVVDDDAVGQIQNARAAFYTCPNRSEVLHADPGLDRELLQRQLQSLTQRLPSPGLPCKNDLGEPFAIVLPFTIQRPRR
jgi:TPR repeat protein